jgi:alpha-L-rhamnosidase
LRAVTPQALNLTDPVGVQETDIRLSWRLESSARGVIQTHYRVEAASSSDALSMGKADLWDSDKVASNRSFDIPYGGPPLISRQRVWWRVTVWDNMGNRAVSSAAFWEMGLLQPSDWTADWIGAEVESRRADRDAGLYWMTGPATESKNRYFRMGFALETDADLILIMAVTSSVKVFIDGEPLSVPATDKVEWGWPLAQNTAFSIPKGKHTLCIALEGDSLAPNFRKGELTAALLLRARLNDGRIVRFTAKDAKISDIEADGWSAPEFDDRRWPAVIRDLKSQMPFPSAGAAALRKDFDVQRAIRSARIYVTALGVYELFLNGRKVGDDLLAPEWTDSQKRIFYRVHDVTAQLAAGPNTLGALVGDGWHAGRILSKGRYGFGDIPIRLRAQLEIAYSDGTREIVQTGKDWALAPSPVTFCEIYDGEDYDARLEQPGWDASGFKAGPEWAEAAVVPSPKGQLIGMITPPIRRTDTLPAKSVKPSGDGWVIDLGQNFAGWVRLKVRGQAGDRVTLKFAEVLKADGSIDQSNLRTARAADHYTLKGATQGEVWEPRFTYHGFRYVEVTGLRQAPKPDDITGIVIHSHVAQTGHLRIGNALIMQGWQNNLWSQRSNFMGVPTDCPQRDERMAWLGDANVFWDTAAFNMDVASFTRQWMGDLRDSQTAEGVVPEICPTGWGASGARGATPGWADAAVTLPWTVWQRYGDTTIIDQNWDMMVRHIAFVAGQAENFIWTKRRGSDYADWLALDAVKPGDPTTPKDLIGTACWKQSVDLMIDMARATNRSEAVARYTKLSADITTAFNTTFIEADGTVGNDSQTSYILALRYKLVPEARRKAVADKLKGNIIRRGNLLTTGFLGTPNSLDVLADAGFADIVYDLLLRTEFPSWGYMVARGATTTWERWNSDTGDVSMNSFNHYALGAINGFVYRRIAGIDPIEPGFRRFRVNPVIDPRVKAGGGEYRSVSGLIRTQWAQSATGFSLDLTVPANTEAELYLPTVSVAKIREGGKALTRRKEIRVDGPRDGRTVVRVGSGTYRFLVSA